jgi:lipid-binding SYLF domain-containing protein
MQRILMAAAFSLLALASAHAQSDEQALVDRATLALQEMMTQTVSQDPRRALQSARGVLICPQIFRAGFFIGGEGGGCVLVARGADNTWSYPAFYGMGSGSFGLQIGIQDSQFVMMIMTERGLHSVLDSQVKLGADVSIAVATLGAGVQGSTTAALGADIVAFSSARGLYGGITLAGSVMGARPEWNRAYYGRDFGAQDIVIGMQGSNQGADPLREILTRYGTTAAPALPPAQTEAAPPPPGTAPPGAASPGTAPPGAVQQQSLPPPPHG